MYRIKLFLLVGVLLSVSLADIEHYHSYETLRGGNEEVLLVDFNRDGTPEFMFSDMSGMGIETFVIAGTNNIIVHTAPNDTVIKAMAEGDTVGQAGDFATKNAVFINPLGYPNAFHSTNGDDQYIGVEFLLGTTLHYGWIRVTLLFQGLDPVTSMAVYDLTIRDFAYETTPGKAIACGDTATVTSSMSQKYRQIQTQGIHVSSVSSKSVELTVEAPGQYLVEIFSVNGQLLLSQRAALTSGRNTLNLSQSNLHSRSPFILRVQGAEKQVLSIHQLQ